MKIAYVANSRVPSNAANSIQVMKMCNAFAAHGHQVVLFAKRSAPHVSLDTLQTFYGTEQPLTVHFYPEVKTVGKRYVHRAFLASKLLVESPDLVFGRDITASYLAAQLGFRTMIELHAHVEEYSDSYAACILKILHHKKLERAIVTSHTLKAALVQDFAIDERLLLPLHNGADLPPTEEAIPLPEGPLHVGYIGHLYRGKGMEVIGELVKRCPWAHFHIIGGRSQDVEQWKDALASHTNITFYGFMAPREVAAYRNAMDVLLLPYQRQVYIKDNTEPTNGRWMTPLKLFEYMAAGKAIIASRLEVTQEILLHRDDALLCDPERLDDWVDALRELHENASLRTLLGINAQAKLTQELTWHTRTQKILATMNEPEKQLS